MKNIIIGTAGHIDHGKTSLIKALTGKDTDRLKEEKSRGITIDLGFAFFELPSGIRAGIIDVPGHEKFIKNMLAGAHGIDIVMLVIAADEGIMPQTKEHVDILSYLNIKSGVIVLTKCDMVDSDWLLMVKEDVRKGLEDTFLKDAPIISVSSVTGYGIDKLVETIDALAQGIEARSSDGIFRLPVDRVFSIPGFGTVVTGTLMSGTIKVGDKVFIYPNMIESKVRNLQVHDKDVEFACAGQRTAINLSNVKVDDIKRGDVIAPAGVIIPSMVIDVRLSLLKSAKPLKNRDRIRFYTGSTEVIGRVILLDRDELNCGDTAYAQIRLEDYVSVLKGDKFVIRTYSPMSTIGGGIVLVPDSMKHKRFKADVIKELEKIEKSGDTFLIEKAVLNSTLPMPLSELEKKMAMVSLKNIVMDIPNIIKMDINDELHVFHKNRYIEVCESTKKILGEFHKKYPLREGMSKEELKSRLFKDSKSKLSDSVFKLMEDEGIIKLKNQIVSLENFKILLSDEQKKLKNEIIKVYDNSHFEVPKPSEFKNYEQIAYIFEYLISTGELIKINENIYLSRNNYIDAQNILVEYLKKHGEITLGTYRDLLNTSRKYAVAILEYFDSIKITKKIGDVRVLYKG